MSSGGERSSSGLEAHSNISGQAATVPSAAIAEPPPYYAPAARVYAVGSAAPAAVLVLWPSGDSWRMILGCGLRKGSMP